MVVKSRVKSRVVALCGWRVDFGGGWGRRKAEAWWWWRVKEERSMSRSSNRGGACRC